MSDDSSEEKTLKPSRQKLKKAREKGNVVTSPFTMNSISLGAVLVYLYMMRETIGVQMMSFFIVEPNDAAADFAVQLQNKAQIIYQLLLKIILPIFVLVIALAVFGGMIISGGPVFSFEPIAPKFEKINPAAGFKKIFGRRALITFLMHILRLTIMSSVLGFLLVGGWGALRHGGPDGGRGHRRFHGAAVGIPARAKDVDHGVQARDQGSGG